MANSDSDSDSVWMYNASFPLAIVGTVIYSLIFLLISYQTLLKHRAWFFFAVPIGAAIEVAAYILRSYSIKHDTQLTPFVLTLTFTILAPVFVAAGNYLLISRLVVAVLPPSSQRILKIPGPWLTPIFVVCDIVALLVQGGGSSIASADDWQGSGERIGRSVLIGGLVFQAVAFSLFLCVFRRFHVLGNRVAVGDAPKGWHRVVRSVYISSGLIMVSSLDAAGQESTLTQPGSMHLSSMRVRRGHERIRLSNRVVVLGP